MAYLDSNGRVDVDLQLDPDGAGVFTGQASDDGFGTVDMLMNIENVYGGTGNDILRGDGNANILFGEEGDDRLIGRGGADLLGGQDGNDVLFGGGGNDTLDGGNGFDEANYSSDTAAVTVNLSDNTATDGFGGTDTLISIEWVVGSAYDDTITGDAGANTLRGGDGNDTITGGAGSDVLEGGDGADTFRFDSTDDGLAISANAPRGPSQVGDILVDFVSGTDSISLDSSFASPFGLGLAFFTIAGAYDGTNSGAMLEEPTPILVYSQADQTLYHDADVATPGYTVVASLMGDAVSVTAGDIVVSGAP